MRVRLLASSSMIVLTLLAAGVSPVGAEESVWGSFGRRMKEGGKAFGDAVSKSVRGQGNAAEWREVGDGFRGAGQEGARAVEETADATLEKVEEKAPAEETPPVEKPTPAEDDAP